MKLYRHILLEPISVYEIHLDKTNKLLCDLTLPYIPPQLVRKAFLLERSCTAATLVQLSNRDIVIAGGGEGPALYQRALFLGSFELSRSTH